LAHLVIGGRGWPGPRFEESEVLSLFTFFKAGAWPLTFALVIALSTLYETISFSDTDTFVSNIV